MKTWLAAQIAAQLRRPHGWLAPLMGRVMNRGNRTLYSHAIRSLQVGPNAKVLEIGFGNGSHFCQILDLDPTLHLTGIESSAEMLRLAERAFRKEIDKGRIELLSADVDLASGSIDVVLAVNVIYFWKDPDANLAEMRRLLKPGGRFVIGFRPYETLAAMPFTRTEFNLRTESDWRERLRLAGFEIEREEAVSAAAGELPGLVWTAVASSESAQSISSSGTGQQV